MRNTACLRVNTGVEVSAILMPFPGVFSGTCPDKDRDSCKYYQAKYCIGSQWSSYMKTFCPYKCGFCPAPST